MRKLLPYTLSTLALAPLMAESAVQTAENSLQQFQQQSRDQLNQIQQSRQQQWVKQHQFQSTNSTASTADFSTACLPYTELKLVGFHLIDPTPFAPQKGECLNENRLNQLSKAITAAYLKQGYIHNPFHFEDDQSGALTLRVIEGKVTKLTTDSPLLNLDMLFPNIIGKPLKVEVLDQGLDQANKMAGSSVSVDVLPAKNGDIELAFVNKDPKRVTGAIKLDNTASKIYHRWQTKFALNIDSPLGLSDSLYLSGSHTLSSRSQFSRSLTLFHSLPYGKLSVNSFLSFSQFQTQVKLPHNNVEQKGRTWQAGLKFDYLLHRGQNHITTAGVQLERIHSKSLFDNSLLNLQSPTLTTVQTNLNHLQLFENASLMFDLSYERGLKWWNSWANKGRDQPEGQFNKWNASLQFDKYTAWQSQIFKQTHRLNAQYSHNYLAGIKQNDLLGRYAVRGFNDLSLSAEKNAVLQNTFSWIKNYQQWQFEPYLLLDMGIQKENSPHANSQRALSYGTGIKLQYSKLSAQLEWAKGRLFRVDLPTRKENTLYAGLSWYF
ncbi:hemin-binding protein [Vespertiliibacter pulmonis]|uniref:Hemolysin activation/secretion protein n=1 Tax=Vespertiliibacter pulmonis TaxID=1443036 RepID=A0A3N4WC25_9PAST|nr:ShlB/FhaC/HecB family hemolysin secretion/activation protein [Vespertiliibacter pulmonis]QLB20923.1 hemin-binding protein [Vespertiliibacter pulmonis]RPE83580.1 hemolysin activation/secretion protein [Vespertiliibacter pulmonis]